MILEAIGALDNDNGSNKTAISGYIKGKYGASLPTDHTSLLTTNLARMKSTGELIFARNNYFRPDNDDEEVVEEEEPSAPAAADPASPLRLDGHNHLAVVSTDVFDADSFFLDADDGLLAPSFLDADADGALALRLGVAADEIAVPAQAPVVTTDAAAGPVKRGRGRPPKPKDPVAEDSSGAPAEASLVATDAVAVPAKRGRGRPPKPKDPVAEASVVATDAAAVPAKRGRGRAPKPKDPVAEASVVATDAAAVPAKRGRGRPPKPKDPAAMGMNGETTAAPVATADAKAPIKRGRGRPPKPKDPITETIARATSGMLSPCGRPPKKAKVEEAPISTPAAAPGTAAPVKRGRGRPPKVRH